MRLDYIFVALAACGAVGVAESNLEVELAQQSNRLGLGIITTMPSSGTFPVRYFDKTWEQVHCCGRISQTWVAIGGRSLITIDSSSSISHPGDPQAWGRNVFLSDLKGVEQRRLPSWIQGSFVAVSSDGKMIAFRGVGGLPPGSVPRPERGLSYGPIDGTTFSKVYSLADSGRSSPSGDERAETLAWSPDARALVYSRDGTIYVYELKQGSPRSLAKGSNPQWSPDGKTISYRGPNHEAMLVNVNGRSVRQILADRKVHYALRWSPVGGYLLLSLRTEKNGVRLGQLCVYRLSDGAMLKLEEPGLGDGFGQDWVLTGPRR